ncbi:hypothetical protein BC828DRAFT_389041 [Blastocladiella britannica]|nr:hypothetical protein BC828DRAFT_389041 [Blastocladiella britannica]
MPPTPPPQPETVPAGGATSGLDAVDLRSSIQAHLRSAGVADQLKAQLRAKIIAQLGSPGAATAMSTGARAAAAHAPAAHGIVHSVANALIADYLAAHGLNYSLSVYLPETTQASPPDLGMEEAIELMRIGGTASASATRVANAMLSANAHDVSLLESIIFGIRALDNAHASSESQTDTASVDLAVREAAELIEQERAEHRRVLQDLVRKHDLVLEDRVARELDRKMAEFRCTELKRVQLEARESAMAKYEQNREALEARHLAQIQALRTDAHEAATRSSAREKELLGEIHALTTQLQGAAESQYQATMASRTARELEDATLHRKIAELTRDLETAQHHADVAARKAARDVESARADAERANADLAARLQVQEARLAADQKVVDAKLAAAARAIVNEDAARAEALAERNAARAAAATISKLQEEVLAARSAAVAAAPVPSDREERATARAASMSRENDDVCFTFVLPCISRKKELICTSSQLRREIRDSQRKLEHANQKLEHTTPNAAETIQSLKMSELKWQTECQGLISRLDRQYRRTEDLERQLASANESKAELRSELAQLRVLLHQVSLNGGRTTPSFFEHDSGLRYMPDHLAASPPAAAGVSRGTDPYPNTTRAAKKSPSRRSSAARSAQSESDSNHDEPSLSGGGGLTPGEGHTSRDSLISDMSVAELRILRSRSHGEQGTLQSQQQQQQPQSVSRRGSRDSLSHMHVPGESAAFMGVRRAGSRDVLINDSPMVVGTSPGQPHGGPGALVDDVPLDLSGSERRILSKRGSSRDGLSIGHRRDSEIGGAPTVGFVTDGMLAGTSAGLGIPTASSAASSAGQLGGSTALFHRGSLTAAEGDPGGGASAASGGASAAMASSVPLDMSGDEIKMLNRRASRDLYADSTDDEGDAAVSSSHHPRSTRTRLSDAGARSLSHSPHPGSHGGNGGGGISRTRSEESLISDMSAAELRLLAETNPGHVAEVDPAPHRVVMSHENLAMAGPADLSMIEKKLLVKSHSSSAAHTPRASSEDLLGAGMRHLFPATGTPGGDGSDAGSISGVSGGGGGTHTPRDEKKVVFLAGDQELPMAGMAAVSVLAATLGTSQSRDSIVSSASSTTRHVVFSTTDDEREVDVHDDDDMSTRRVAFGASSEMMVEPRQIESDMAPPDRPRAVSFDDGFAMASPPPLVFQESVVMVGDNVVAPTSPSAAAATAAVVEDPAKAKEAAMQETARSIANANPKLQEYMARAAAASPVAPAPPIGTDPADEESAKDTSDFGAGETMSVASGTTASASGST